MIDVLRRNDITTWRTRFVEALHACMGDPGFAELDAGAQKRVRETLALMEALSRWTNEMLELDNSTLKKLVKLGAKIQALVRGR